MPTPNKRKGHKWQLTARWHHKSERTTRRMWVFGVTRQKANKGLLTPKRQRLSLCLCVTTDNHAQLNPSINATSHCTIQTAAIDAIKVSSTSKQNLSLLTKARFPMRVCFISKGTNCAKCDWLIGAVSVRILDGPSYKNPHFDVRQSRRYQWSPLVLTSGQIDHWAVGAHWTVTTLLLVGRISLWCVSQINPFIPAQYLLFAP